MFILAHRPRNLWNLRLEKILYLNNSYNDLVYRRNTPIIHLEASLLLTIRIRSSVVKIQFAIYSNPVINGSRPLSQSIAQFDPEKRFFRTVRADVINYTFNLIPSSMVCTAIWIYCRTWVSKNHLLENVAAMFFVKIAFGSVSLVSSGFYIYSKGIMSTAPLGWGIPDRGKRTAIAWPKGKGRHLYLFVIFRRHKRCGWKKPCNNQ